MSSQHRHCPRGSFFPCHPVIYSRDPVKNTNIISIFYYFLDLVPKPRYDYLRAFFDPRRQYLPWLGRKGSTQAIPRWDNTEDGFHRDTNI
ncbi:MAG: hypothetical protein ACRYE8_05265 [Janthinobacterium lividum]